MGNRVDRITVGLLFNSKTSNSKRSDMVNVFAEVDMNISGSDGKEIESSGMMNNSNKKKKVHPGDQKQFQFRVIFDWMISTNI